MQADILILAPKGDGRIHRKNTILMASKPLVSYAVGAALEAVGAGKAYISTDDPDVIGMYRDDKRLKVLGRQEGAGRISVKDAVLHACETAGIGGTPLLVVLNADAPLVTAKEIGRAVSFAASLGSFGSVAGITAEASNSLQRADIDENKKLRVQGPASSGRYRINGSIWVIRPGRTTELDDDLLSADSYGFEMGNIESMRVGSPEDLASAEAMLMYKKECFSPDAKGGFNLERIYMHDDPQMNIRRSVFDSAAYARHEQRYRYFLEHIAAGDHILDIACGSGYGTAILASKAAFVHGVDGDETTVKYARRHYAQTNIKFSVSRAESAAIEEKYDKVISVETIEHIADPGKFLENVRQWLKPGGELWFTCPLASQVSGPSANPFHVSEMTLEQLKALVAGHFKDHRIFNLSGKDIFLRDTLNKKVEYVVVKGVSR
ncbi:MAG: methyltransferase domain-containing protein [Candidatus Omnitrophica bacterium]|nr:methyltransferase domain-containing protein [Candidatus Omnitrophota bacterium]MDD5736833.1 methyltransferase domain-containing protein [Candidatus Omnitrophota bacterium]